MYKKLLVPIILAGCATGTSLTEDEILEKEEERQRFYEDFAICKLAHRGVWVSDGYVIHRRPSYIEHKLEYGKNNCALIVRAVCKRGTIHERC